MNKPRNTHLVPVVVVTAALVAAGTAYAAGKHGSSSSSSPGSSRHSWGSTTSSLGVLGADARGADRRGHGGEELAVAATYLGLSEADLITAFQSGKTLAQIADATSGKSAAGLIDALVAAEKTKLATAVAAGTITQAQSDQIAARISARVTARVNGTTPEHGRRGFGGRGSWHDGLRPGYRVAPAYRATPGNGTHI